MGSLSGAVQTTWLIHLRAHLEHEVVHAPSIHFCTFVARGACRTDRLGPWEVSFIELASGWNEGLGHAGLGEAHSEYAYCAKPVTTVVKASRSTMLSAPNIDVSVASNAGIL